MAKDWLVEAEIDPVERLSFRLHQKAYLSHYSSEPRESWDDKPTTELDEFYGAVSDIIKRENG